MTTNKNEFQKNLITLKDSFEKIQNILTTNNKLLLSELEQVTIKEKVTPLLTTIWTEEQKLIKLSIFFGIINEQYLLDAKAKSKNFFSPSGYVQNENNCYLYFTSIYTYLTTIIPQFITKTQFQILFINPFQKTDLIYKQIFNQLTKEQTNLNNNSTYLITVNNANSIIPLTLSFLKYLHFRTNNTSSNIEDIQNLLKQYQTAKSSIDIRNILIKLLKIILTEAKHSKI